MGVYTCPPRARTYEPTDCDNKLSVTKSQTYLATQVSQVVWCMCRLYVIREDMSSKVQDWWQQAGGGVEEAQASSDSMRPARLGRGPAPHQHTTSTRLTPKTVICCQYTHWAGPLHQYVCWTKNEY